MTIQICTNNGIIVDGVRAELPYKDAQYRKLGLFVTQRDGRTIVYSAALVGGAKYTEHTMPHAHYSLTHAAPISGAPGLNDLEAAIRAILTQ